MKSIWNNINRPCFDELKENIKTDVLIIGGGIAGIMCAYMLKDAGIDCVLAEKDRICSGVTENTTAKITVQHGLIYDKIIKEYGVEKAKLYYEINEKALSFYRRKSSEFDCDFEEADSFVYSLNDREKIENEVDALNNIGCNATFENDINLPFSVAGMVKIKNQAQFNPLKFLYSVSEKLRIYENTRITELKGNQAITEKGNIRAEKIIVATHFPFINKHGFYFMKMYQHRSYVIALKNTEKINGMYVDENERGLSFRNYGDLLLLGGGSHRTGKSGGNWEELRSFARDYYPDSTETAHWATQDCMTLDGIPYIGRYSKNTPSLYVATGFNKWGMTSAVVAAMILRDLIQGKENEYSSVFLPDRRILHPQLFLNTAEAITSLLTPTLKRCPHMGCALKYNRYEHSWDCPCHGSRFDERGKLLDNPATKDNC